MPFEFESCEQLMYLRLVAQLAILFFASKEIHLLSEL